MKTYEKLPGRLLVALLVGAALAGLVGCPNLSRDLDLKARIETDVAEANAEEILVTIQPELDAMGLTSPSGSAQVKIGVAFKVTASAYSEYVFVRWEKTEGEGDVVFTDATSRETMATVSGAGTRIVITARFDARPAVDIKDPDGGENILTNRKIYITFSKPVNPNTVRFTAGDGFPDTIDISSRSRNFPEQPLVSIEDKLNLEVDPVGKTLVTISLKDGELYDPQYYVWIKILKSVKDLSGNMMKEDVSWYFITGDDADASPPNLISFSILDGAATIPDNGYTNHREGLTLHTAASDNDALGRILVKEGAGAEQAFPYAADLSYDLQASADGPIDIAVVVTDRVGNRSLATLDQTIILDRVAPAAPGVPVYAGGAWIPRSVNESGFTLTVSLPVAEADPAQNVKAGDTLQLLRNASLWKSVTLVQGDVDAGTRTVTVGARELGADGGADDDDKLITARLSDAAGNVGAASSSDLLLKLDTVVPAVEELSSSDADGIVKDGDTLTLTVTFTQAVVATPAVTIVGGGSAVYQSGSGSTWTYSWTVNGADGAESNVAAVISAQDAAGNPSTDGTGPHNFHIDNIAPAVVGLSSSDADGIVKDGDTVSLTATFTQAVVATPTITIVGGGSAVHQSGSGTSWTYSWTVNGADGAESNVAAVIGAQDAAGNPSTDATGPHNFHIDNVSPAAPGVPVYAGGTWIPRSVNEAGFTLTVALPTAEADPAQNIKAGDTLQLLRDGSLWKSVTLLQADVDASSRTVSVGARELGVDGGTEDGDKLIRARLSDAAGNVGAASSTDLLLKLDTKLPGVSLAYSGHPDTTVKNGDTVTFTATFTESVVATPTLTIAGGGAVTNTGGSGTSWTYSWTVAGGPTMDSDATVVVSATDAAGNANTTATGSTTFHIDNVAPGVSLAYSGHPDTTVKNGDTVTFTATFTESVVATPTLTIAGGGAVTNTGGSGTSWTYSWTVAGGPTMDSDATVVVSATDAAGNANTTATGSTTFHIDNVKPLFFSVTLSDAPKNKTATAVFTEPVYANANATGALVGSSTNGSSDITVTENSAAADITAWEITPAHTAGSDTLTVDLTWSGTPTTGVDIVTVAAANGTSIYDAAGNAMDSGSSGGGTAKSLALSLSPLANHSVTASVASSKSAGAASWSLPFLPIGRDPLQGIASAELAAATTRSLPTAKSEPVQQKLTLEYFRRPLQVDREKELMPAETATTASDAPELPARSARTSDAPAEQAVVVRASLADSPALAGLAMQPAEERQASSPWLAVGLALCAALLLACGLFAARLLARPGSRRRVAFSPRPPYLSSHERK